jgi:hypothetical protein
MDQEFKNKVAEFRAMFPNMTDQEVFDAALRFVQARAQQPHSIEQAKPVQKLTEGEYCARLFEISLERSRLKRILESQRRVRGGFLTTKVIYEYVSSRAERESARRRLEELDKLENDLRRRQALGE